jgi:hypothetical protein
MLPGRTETLRRGTHLLYWRYPENYSAKYGNVPNDLNQTEGRGEYFWVEV